MFDHTDTNPAPRDGSGSSKEGLRADLTASSRPDLIECWGRLYGQPPPTGISRRLLLYAIAYSRQAKSLGHLKQTTRRKLRRLATKPARQRSTTTRAKPKSECLPPGTLLVREWQGRSHVVEVNETGMHYNGQTHGSLSEIARVITGARWSGPRFFGV